MESEGDKNAAVEPQHSAADTCPIVGIGASAGGLEAIEGVIRPLNCDNMAYVVLQHLGPGKETLLAEILARSTKMGVRTITDGAAVEKNHIYVGPPGFGVLVENRHFKLTEMPTGASGRHTIDLLFRSIALEAGSSAVGV